MNQEETEKKKKIKAAQNQVIYTLIKLELAAQTNHNSIFEPIKQEPSESPSFKLAEH